MHANWCQSSVQNMDTGAKLNSTTNFKRLREIFDEDGKQIRDQFILAGLILTIFERLKEYVTKQVDDFFSDRIEVQNGEIRIIRSAEFKRLIKEKGAGNPGQHDNRAFRAAVRWFYDVGAIDQVELDSIERVYTLRNEIGHELFRIVADDMKQPICLGDVLVTFGIYVKIVRWWIKEVEATTDPDMTTERYENIDWDQVESADTVFLREVLNKALAENTEWKEVQKWAHGQPQP
jgi:hypothetical protein